MISEKMEGRNKFTCGYRLLYALTGVAHPSEVMLPVITVNTYTLISNGSS